MRQVRTVALPLDSPEEMPTIAAIITVVIRSSIFNEKLGIIVPHANDVANINKVAADISKKNIPIT